MAKGRPRKKPAVLGDLKSSSLIADCRLPIAEFVFESLSLLSTAENPILFRNHGNWQSPIGNVVLTQIGAIRLRSNEPKLDYRAG